MKRVVLYHGDADGRCAAAIAGRHGQAAGFEIVYREMYYDTPVPWDIITALEPLYDQVWIVDFSLSLSDMKRLLGHMGAPSVCWIDHHKTALSALSELTDSGIGIDGLRSVDSAGCVLTWLFCYPDLDMPSPVRFIGDRDIWKFAYGNATRYFYEAYLQETDNHPAGQLWDLYFNMSTKTLGMIIDRGSALYRARIKGLARHAKAFGWPETLPGCPSRTVLKVNLPGTGDLGQVIKDMGFDVAWCYVDKRPQPTGPIVRTHSLYSHVVDVGEFCRRQGGGGHAGAAGYTERL